MKDMWDEWGWVLYLVILLGLIGLGIWLSFFAPCEYVDWMPTKELPGRCLPGGRG